MYVILSLQYYQASELNSRNIFILLCNILRRNLVVNRISAQRIDMDLAV